MINQRKAGILLNYISEAIKILTALIYTPVMLRLLGQREYGLYQLVGSVVSYLSLLSFGFGSAYVRFYSAYKIKDEDDGIARLNGMFLIIFCAMAALCLLCGGVLAANAQWVFGGGLTAWELKKAKLLLLVLVGNMALTFPDSVFHCYITAHERFVFQKLLRVAQSLLNPFLTLPLLMLGYGSVAVVVVSTLLTAAVLLSDIVYCRKELKMVFSFRGMRLSLLREMWGFTFFIFLNQIIDQVNWSVDKFLLGRMCGTAAVAVYGIGGQINALYMQMSIAVSGVFAPKVNRLAAESESNDALTRLMAKVGRVQFLVLGLILTGFMLFGRPFVRLWAGGGYEDAYEVALLLILPVTVPLIQNLGIEIQRARNKHRVRSVVYACLAAGNVVLSIFLIEKWGCVGAAAGTAVAMILGNVLFMNWYYHRKIGLDMVYFWKKIGDIVPALLLALLAGMLLRLAVPASGWGTLLLSCLLYAGAYGMILWRFGLNAYEKELVKTLLRKIR